MTQPPFSARNHGKRTQIDQDFPDTARNGLLHVVHDLMDKCYLSSWAAVGAELRRIAREAPGNYNSSSASVQRAQNDIAELILKVQWAKVFDFCERLHNHLAVEVGAVDFNDNYYAAKPRSEVQEYVATELQRLFLEEGLAFEFSDGLVRRRGRKHTVETITRADVVLDDTRLVAARKHYGKALWFFRHPSQPDYQNCVKEAVCAVEAAGKALFPEAKASTLGELLKWMGTAKDVSLPKALAQVFHGTYGFRSGGEGIGHGGSTGGHATRDAAEFVLSVSASQIIYLVDLDNGRQVDVPF